MFDQAAMRGPAANGIVAEWGDAFKVHLASVVSADKENGAELFFAAGRLRPGSKMTPTSFSRNRVTVLSRPSCLFERGDENVTEEQGAEPLFMTG